MKKLFLFLAAFACFSAQAQPLVVKKEKKTRKAKTTRPTEPKNYTSKNGTIIVHTIDKNEQLDTVTNAKEIAPHINKNFSETLPALSPSNGGN